MIANHARAITPAVGFGAVLRAARESRELSQARLAQLVDMNYTSISRVESGSRAASRETVRRLADALGMQGWPRVMFWAAAGMVEHPASVTFEVATAIVWERMAQERRAA